MIAVRRAFASVLVASALLAPSQARSDVPATGFRSSGTLVVRALLGGNPVDVGGTILLYRLGSMYRLDVLSLGFPGLGSTASAAASTLLAPGGATLVYNGLTGAVSAYSTGNHVYYQGDAKTAPAGAAAQSAEPASVGPADPLAALAGVVQQLHDVTQASIQLTGHSVTNGHPTDDLDVLVHRQRPGKTPEDYHAQLALADDLGGFPIRISLSSKPATPQDFGGSLRLDLTAIAAEAPTASVFAIPAGYRRVTSLGAILQTAP